MAPFAHGSLRGLLGGDRERAALSRSRRLGITATEAQIAPLMDAYLSLATFPEVRPRSRALAGTPLGILSNGSPRMLEAAVALERARRHAPARALGGRRRRSTSRRPPSTSWGRGPSASRRRHSLRVVQRVGRGGRQGLRLPDLLVQPPEGADGGARRHARPRGGAPRRDPGRASPLIAHAIGPSRSVSLKSSVVVGRNRRGAWKLSQRKVEALAREKPRNTNGSLDVSRCAERADGRCRSRRNVLKAPGRLRTIRPAPKRAYFFARRFFFTYAQIFFVISEGPMGLSPMTVLERVAAALEVDRVAAERHLLFRHCHFLPRW